MGLALLIWGIVLLALLVFTRKRVITATLFYGVLNDQRKAEPVNAHLQTDSGIEQLVVDGSSLG